MDAADGQSLELIGQATVTLEVGNLCTVHNVVIVQSLTQECILGADFLTQYDCVVNFQRQDL